MLSDYWWKLRNYPAGHNKRSEVFDACPRSALADVEAVFLEDFGRSPGEIFKTFDS